MDTEERLNPRKTIQLSKTMEDYLQHMRAETKQDKTVKIELYTAGLLGCEPKTATQDDIDKALVRIANMDLSDTTKSRYRHGIRLYLRWAGNPLAAGIKLNLKRKQKKREDLLDGEEIKRLIDAATTPRDKAIVSVMLESGFRVGEMISLQVKGLKTYPEGYADLLPSEENDTKTGKCKTGSYTATLIDSLPFLRAWLEEHPNKNKNFQESALFVKRDGSPLEYHGFNKVLKRLGAKAGINKRIHPHLLRHVNATMLALKGWTTQEINVAQGREQDSTIANTYIHLVAKDIRTKKLEERGFKQEGKRLDGKPIFEYKKCWKCSESNPIDRISCFHCSAPLEGNERFKELAQALDFWESTKKASLDGNYMMDIQRRLKILEDTARFMVSMKEELKPQFDRMKAEAAKT